MRKFIITVNGKSYEVEVEELKQDGTSVSHTSFAATTSIKSSQDKESDSKEKTMPASKPVGAPVPKSAETIKAPMPGTIVEIKVNSGDTISKGQVLVILEAMKMENEIVSPKDGKVVSIQVAKGSSVNAGDVLIAIQ